MLRSIPARTAGLIMAATTMLAIPRIATADPAGDLTSMTLEGFTAGITAEIRNPAGSLPGTNDFGCVPSDAHPRPVVLLHGTFANQQTNWGAYAPLLKREGYCVFAPTYGALTGAPWPMSALGGQKAIAEGAAELGPFIEKVLAAAKSERVDIVAHSLGTITGAYYVKKYGGAPYVDKMVSLAPVLGGSNYLAFTVGNQITTKMGIEPSDLPICRSCIEGAPDSAVVRSLNDGGTPYVEGVDYTNISTIHDSQVVPYTLGQVPPTQAQQVHNLVLQDGCPQDRADHFSIVYSPRAAVLVLDALDPSRNQQAPCGQR